MADKGNLAAVWLFYLPLLFYAVLTRNAACKEQNGGEEYYDLLVGLTRKLLQLTKLAKWGMGMAGKAAFCGALKKPQLSFKNSNTAIGRLENSFFCLLCRCKPNQNDNGNEQNDNGACRLHNDGNAVEAQWLKSKHAS